MMNEELLERIRWDLDIWDEAEKTRASASTEVMLACASLNLV